MLLWDREALGLPQRRAVVSVSVDCEGVCGRGEDGDLGKLVRIGSGVLQVWGVIADFVMQGNEMIPLQLSTESVSLLFSQVVIK